MRGSYLLAVATGLAVAACAPSGATLTVDLETDLVPGVDFDTVSVEVAAPDYTLPTLAPGAISTRATIGVYVPGRRVAEVHDVAVGDHLVRVRLLDTTGATVVERIIRLQIQSTYSLTVILTRDCAGIVCPEPGGDPALTSCVAGACASATCSPLHPEACAAPDCRLSTDCVPTSSCVHPVCDQGTCLMVGRDADCDSGLRCDPTLGCVLPNGELPMDAGMPPGDSCPTTELSCTNGADDDCDGTLDCADADCDGATCDDAHVCTTTDQCASGTCVGTALTCDDGVGCTTDACSEPMGCTHTATDALCTLMAGGHCDPLHDCQYPTCSAATCVATDGCDVAACAGSVCTHAPRTCATGEVCCGGACHATACSDPNVCTTDSFNAATCACVHTNNTATCSDGNACTTGDRCSAGRCTGAAANCNDNLDCTADACNTSTGCTHTAHANGTSCNDGGGTTCCSGSCVSLSARAHCGSCGASCASGTSCVTVPGRSGVYTCTCGSNAQCQGEGFGGMATCYSGYCDCQCAAASPATCGGQCSSGATCHELSGHNYCQYP